MDKPLEHILTNSYKAGMISYMEAHPEDFDETVRLAVSDNQPYAWRAAWLLWSCMKKNDPRIQRYIKNIIDTLKQKIDNHQRELLKILLEMELNEEYESLLFDICVAIWEKTGKQPSVRLNAIRMMVKIAKKYPELTNEIVILIQEQYLDSLSPAARKSIYKMIKKLNL